MLRTSILYTMYINCQLIKCKIIMNCTYTALLLNNTIKFKLKLELFINSSHFII